MIWGYKSHSQIKLWIGKINWMSKNFVSQKGSKVCEIKTFIWLIPETFSENIKVTKNLT